MTLAQRLLELRESKGFDQPELSVKSGVAISTISRLENGKGQASKSTLRNLASALDGDFGELYALSKGRPVPQRVQVRPQPDFGAALRALDAKLDEILKQTAANGDVLAAVTAGIMRLTPESEPETEAEGLTPPLGRRGSRRHAQTAGGSNRKR